MKSEATREIFRLLFVFIILPITTVWVGMELAEDELNTINEKHIMEKACDGQTDLLTILS